MVGFVRQIVAISHITLDGVVQGPGGAEEDVRDGFAHGGWIQTYGDPDMREALHGLMAREFDLLLGRFTYDIWAPYWPKNTDGPIGAAFARATKYVVSGSPIEWSWPETRVLRTVADVAALRSSEGPDLHLWGSGLLFRSLLAAGLVDEMRLWTYPLVLGSGRRLFAEGSPVGWSLAESRITSRGVALQTHRREVADGTDGRLR